MSQEFNEDAQDAPPEHSARMEGRICAIEGILRTQQLRGELEAGSRAITHLRGEVLPPRERPTVLPPLVQAGNPDPAQPSSKVLDAVRVTRRVATMTGKHRPVGDSFRQRRWRSSFLRQTATWLAGLAATVMIGLVAMWLTYSEVPSHSQMTIDEVQGEAVIITTATNYTRKAEKGAWILPGQSVVLSDGSMAKLRFEDNTLMELFGGSSLSLNSSPRGKALELSKGRFRFNVSTQPFGNPLSIQTQTANIEVLGTSFAVSASGSATEVDVEEGRVQLTRSSDAKSVELPAGFNAVAAPNTELSARKLAFVKGVNLSGDSVVIEGHRWQSYVEGLQTGLSHGKLSSWNHPKFRLLQPQDPDTTAMLQSGLWTNENAGDDDLILSQTLPNGTYKVYIWSVENARPNYRRLSVTLNGVLVASGVGCVPFGEWAKCGPYSATVNNGVLALKIGGMTGNSGERHINGYAIFKVE